MTVVVINDLMPKSMLRMFPSIGNYTHIFT